tara:strand:+ start:310 stop:696 length:387 start_codon:yes stop_codon:yes gene_type:complete
MSAIPELTGGRSFSRPMNRGAQAISAGGAETTLVLNATSTSGEAQVMGEILMIDPGGAIDLKLPPEAASDGMVLMIHNTDGDSVAITVESSSGGNLGHGSKPVIAQDEGGIFFCDGTSWYGYTLKALT